MHALLALAVFRFGLTLSLGPEYDSNANRAEVVSGTDNPDQPTGSFLLRTIARAQLAWRSGRNLVRASAGIGGKIYFNPQVFDQDVLVLQVAGEDRVRAARFAHVSVAAEYYDAWQLTITPNRHRDFRTGAIDGRLHLLDRLGDVTLAGGFRGFAYKPDGHYDFEAGQATAATTTRMQLGRADDHDLDVTASFHMERRYFADVVEVLDEQQCPPGHDILYKCLIAGTAGRADWFYQASVDLTYVGPLLASVGYGVQLNLSNSFGLSLLRHVITLKLGYRFPWSLYATAKAQLYVTRYLDPVLLDTPVRSLTPNTIEDEDRNAFIADIERPIGATGLAVEARYSLYTNQIAPSPSSFLRQIVYIGLTYRAGAR